MTRFEKGIVLVSLVALAVGGVVLSARKETGELRTAAPGEPAGQPGLEPRPSAPARALTPSPARRATTHTLSIDQRFGADDGQSARFALQATLDTAPVAGDAKRDAVKLEGVSIEANGGPGASELEVVFLRVRDQSGRLVALSFPPRVPARVRPYLKSIAALIQYTGAPAASQDSWRVEETDLLGRYAASYSRKSASVVEKRRLGYVELHGGKRDVAADVSGTTRFDLAGGEIAAMETDERLSLTSGDLLRTKGTLNVKLVRSGERAADWVPQSFVGWIEESLDAAASTRATREDDALRVAGRTFEDMDKAVRALASLDPDARSKAAAELVLDLGALARLDPTSVAQMEAALLDPATPAHAIDVHAGALAEAGTLDATRSLLSVLDDASRPDARRHAAVSLALTEAHDGETLAKLAAHKDPDPEVANVERLALGAASRTVNESRGASKETEQAARALAAAYQEATTIDAQIDAVLAIGNSGDPANLHLLERALASGNPDLMTSAMFAMRFMDAPAVDGHLSRAIQSGAPAMQIAALRALEHRPLGGLRADLQAALQRERLDADVRSRIEAILGRTGS